MIYLTRLILKLGTGVLMVSLFSVLGHAQIPDGPQVPDAMANPAAAAEADAAAPLQNVVDAAETAGQSLFIPIQPGATPTPPALPTGTPPTFVPSPISPPAIQSGPVTQDVLPEDYESMAIIPPIPTPTPTPVPTPVTTTSKTPVAQPKPTPAPSPKAAASAKPTPAQTSPKPAPTATPRPAASTQSSTPKRSTTASSSSSSTSSDQIRRMVGQANQSQSASQATAVGWAYYNRNDFSSAGQWFNQALDWNSNYGEAAYGLALSKFREGDLASAEAIVNFRRNSYPKMRTLEGDIAARRAVDAYSMERYGQSLDYMATAAKARPLSRNEQIIYGWSLYYTKNYKEAADLFEALYRKRRDQTSAEGLYASLSKLQDYQRIDKLAALPGPFREVYSTYDARRYYAASLFRASLAAKGDKIFPVLKNIDSPSVALGMSYRYKSGSPGEGRLNEGRIPVFQGQFFPSNKTMISGRLSHIILSSNSLNDGANVGTVPKTFKFYSYKPTTYLKNLWEFAVRFEYQDWWSFYFEIGATPINGPLVSRPVGNAGIIYRHEHGYAQFGFFSKSVKESMLSYVGIRDPYEGGTWGRVTDTGVSAELFRSFAGHNTIFVKALYGYLSGTNVRNNQHVSLTLALAHNFNIEGFEYFTFGPAFSFEHFENNQNYFTWGHGGYFSPEYMVQGLLGVNFLTTEGGDWLVSGGAGAGVQSNRQASTPYLPFNPDGREYPSRDSTTAIALVNASAGFLISQSFLLGVSGSFSVTADYNEGFASIWLRYFFEPRNGLLRTDLSLE